MINNKKPYMIGISGGSASGKSTLCKLIKERLNDYNIASITADTYYKKNMPIMISPITGEEGKDWNTPDALEYEQMMKQYREYITDIKNDIVIIEGAFIFCYPELREMLDLKIYIELDSDIRMYRRIKRNMAVRGLTIEEVADYYTEYAKFSESKNTLNSKIYADIIMNGINFQNKACDMLEYYIKNELADKR